MLNSKKYISLEKFGMSLFFFNQCDATFFLPDNQTEAVSERIVAQAIASRVVTLSEQKWKCFPCWQSLKYLLLGEEMV